MTEEKSRILVADDDDEIRKTLRYILEREGFEVITAVDGEEAIQKIYLDTPDAVLLDVCMPGLNGIEVLRKVKAIDDDLPVVLVTAYSDTHQAVAVMKEGAYDYLAKPFDNKEVVWTTSRALAEGKVKRHLKTITDCYDGIFSLVKRMGPSEKISRLAADVHRVAKSDFSVIVIGETGSGKELVARAIHSDSNRLKGPFVAVDCGAIPENLLETELFGHEKGSFTGADRQTTGKFESANGGTLFMDEIGNMPLSSQAKVLRVIQDLKFYRVGGNKPVPVDIRLIAATNQDLLEKSLSGAFRNDLYYRLNEFTIYVPALRERKEDIPYLANRFLNLANCELNKMITGFTDSAMETLMSYDWPGNVRQLRSVIRRATLVAGAEITEKDISINHAEVPAPASPLKVQGMPWEKASLSEIVQQSVLAVEKELLKEALRFTGGNKAKAARLLQVDYKTVQTKIKKFGIEQIGGKHGD